MNIKFWIKNKHRLYATLHDTGHTNTLSTTCSMKQNTSITTFMFPIMEYNKFLISMNSTGLSSRKCSEFWNTEWFEFNKYGPGDCQYQRKLAVN